MSANIEFSFNVHGVIYVGDEGECYPCSPINFQLINTFDAETVAPIEREIRDFANGLKTVKDEQEYIVVRERRHRNTAESTNSRVKWWSIFQTVVLFAMVGWQVYYLKVRRVCLIPCALYSTCFTVILRSEAGILARDLSCTYFWIITTIAELSQA